MSSKEGSDAASSKEDVAQTYREITKGEQTAAALEANLTNLESKLDAILAALEDQEGQEEQGQGQPSADSGSGETNGDSSKKQP